MTLSDEGDSCTSIVESDLTFFDLESNYSNDSVHLLYEKYTHKLPMKDESKTAFRLTPTNEKLYKQNTLDVHSTFKERFVVFTKPVKSIQAKVRNCKPNKYVKVTFILAILIPLAVWTFYIDVNIH
ncbi:YCL021W-A [Saccharomyces arboricola H-6]|uniref:YCL021W-A n=1 Tax=Saccharomyces arboricola (strain H-6 / AS 2.3317 / CBS 10644) TaxID=1160507 RepID=J8Q4B9_SACAR|nr:YCL021W-A [Saccharomyces arboricola H-6]